MSAGPDLVTVMGEATGVMVAMFAMFEPTLGLSLASIFILGV